MRYKVRYTTISLLIVFTVSAFLYAGQNKFKNEQLKFSRVRDAYKSKEELMKKMFELKKVSFPPKEIYIRAFKREGILELWARSDPDEKYELIKTFSICAKSGRLGPKRKEGDLQVPEGFYYIDRFNPVSNYHLSLGLNYPNKSDRILGDPKHPGGDIFIHGNCVTIGCIPIRDSYIKELYISAVEAKNNGQDKIPVHIFPCRMTDQNNAGLKKLLFSEKITLFWDDIKSAYDYFEKNRQLPVITTDSHGKYHIK